MRRPLLCFISYTKGWKTAWNWENFPFFMSYSSAFTGGIRGRNCIFSFPPYCREQITMNILSRQCWPAAHGQSQGSPFPHLHPPLPRNNIWILDMQFPLPYSSSDGRGHEVQQILQSCLHFLNLFSIPRRRARSASLSFPTEERA